MNPVAANQGRTFLRLWSELQPHLRTDRSLPARLQQRLAGEKRFGSRDRRLYRELCYTALRHLPWMEELLQRSEEEALRGVVWMAVDSPATRPLKESLLGDWPPCPLSVAAKAARLGVGGSILPDWFRVHCPAAFEAPEIDVLQTRSPMWLRLQSDHAQPLQEEFAGRMWPLKRSTVLASAYRVDADVDVTKTDAFTAGEIEVQDLGSQLLLETVPLQAGSRWRDACAGAGGKTLQLARLLGPSGRVDATDVRSAALEELKLRATRAGLRNVNVARNTSAPEPVYDGVLVDAPCSGSGTWRRAPHLKWCTSEQQVATASDQQKRILNANAGWVRPGGLLVYATCSLSRRENEDIVGAFLNEHAEFAPAPFRQDFGALHASPAGLNIRPSLHDTDGFYVACLVRRS